MTHRPGPPPGPPGEGPPAGGPTHAAPPRTGERPAPPHHAAADPPPEGVAAKAPPLAETILGGAESSLLDLVDHLLDQGVVVTGDVVLGLAGIDLVYLRVSLLLAAADRVLPGMALAGHEGRRKERRAGERAPAG
ncbi:MAG TPA: gas vesicle protein [Thermoanaerobaculia bacterium]